MGLSPFAVQRCELIEGGRRAVRGVIIKAKYEEKKINNNSNKARPRGNTAEETFSIPWDL